MTPEPRFVLLRVCASNCSPKKWRKTGSSMNGCRWIFISFVVKMFTTAGIARFAASLNEEIFFASPWGAASRMVTTPPRGAHPRRSGRSVLTTNSAATHTVAV
jgi:hypothetical protein